MKYERTVPKHTYTVEPGREIYKDGKPFIRITRHEGFDPFVSPAEVDSLTKEICGWLNNRDENQIA